jgi:hypothetical protein
MYDLEALKRLISKKGLATTVSYLEEPNLPSYLKKTLEKEQIFSNGKLRPGLISSLAHSHD